MNSMTGYRGPAGGNLATRQAGSFKGDVIPKGYKGGQLAQFTPEQMQLFQQLFSNVGPESFLSRLGMGEESGFEQAEAPAWKQFAEAQGQLGSRFSQLAPGAMSAQKGSGFQNQAGQLGSDFAMNLASRRQDLQRQALIDLMGLSNSLLGQRPFQRDLFEKPQKQALGGIGGALGTLAGGGLGFLGGGPAGAYAGSYIGGRALSGL